MVRPGRNQSCYLLIHSTRAAFGEMHSPATMNSDELYFLPRGAFPVAGADESQQTGYWVLLRDVPREELEVGQACRIHDSKPGNESEYARKDFPRYERIKVFPQGSGGSGAVDVDRRVV